MNTKLLTGAGCLLLLVAAIAPSVLGHDDNNTDPGTSTDAGVSGTFVGAAGPAVVPAGDNAASYADTLSAGLMLCDVEVAGNGDAPETQDEELVDQATGGNAPDGTFDDGGFGGVCHTNHYGHPDYNTQGCPDEKAYGYDQSGENPFIAASCDFQTNEGGTDSGTLLVGCVANTLLTFDLTGVPPQGVLDLVGCVVQFVTCVLDPTCVPQDSTVFCGADSTADGVNYGHGNPGVAYPRSSAHQGTPRLDAVDNERVTDVDCDENVDVTAGTFVFEAVVVDGEDSHVHPATTGTIHQQA